MNNKNGSALQKANFALLVLAVSGLAYLIVRERTESERIRTTELSPPVHEGQAGVGPQASKPAEIKSSFTRLRPREMADISHNLAAQTRPAEPESQPEVITEPVVRADAGLIEAALPTPLPGATAFGGVVRVAGASVTGSVQLRGTPPPERQITLDAVCGKLHPTPMFTRHYVVSRDGGLGNVLVYVKVGAPKDESRPDTKPILDNVNCEFQPYLLGIRTRQPLTVRNSDPVLHNVHATPKSGGNREFNLGLPSQSTRVIRGFEAPELVRFKCDVHPWMFAYVSVLDHRWFAVTDAEGNFALPPGLPTGRYTIAAVHLKAGESVQQITISEGTAPVLRLTLDVPSDLARSNGP